MERLFKIGAVISYIISFIFVGLGFDKISRYVNPDADYYSYSLVKPEPVNVYVGGDAYNYIINSNYAVGFFVLAVFFAILGSTLVLIYYISKSRDLLVDEDVKYPVINNE